MSKPLDPRIAEILTNFGEDPRDTKGVIWDCHGTWVVYHRALERVAARAGVSFDRPDVLRSERDEAVILVTGRMGDRVDWDIGEAVINVNYRVSGKQAAFVYAMALKRARDRLILKLIGLHGLLYSEVEADEFKGQRGARRAEPDDDWQDEGPVLTASQLMAESMMETLRTRAGVSAVEAFLAKPKVQRDLALLELDEHMQVMAVAAEQRALEPAVGVA